MLVVTPYHPGDADQALRMFRWISELEGRQVPHDLLLIADSRCAGATAHIEASARQAFRSVETLSFVDHFRKWPDAPNAVFAFAARHIMANQRVPWLFLEPDCCPLKAGWLDAIEAEYKAARKPFMGARVEVNDVPLHMSGNACYPVDMFAHAGLALIAGDIAFDVAAASQIVPQAHFTKLIVHNWKHEPFKDQGEAENLLSNNPEAVLFHADKSGSLIELLRERKNNLSGGVESRHAVAELRDHTPSKDGRLADSGSSAPPAQTFCCDIFVKSWHGDFQWLEYCHRSVTKFAKGFRRVVVVIPDKPEVHDFGMGMIDPHCVTLRIQEPEGDGYLRQQVEKLRAYEYTDASHILFLDSDTIFTRPVTPETYFVGDKIAWLMTPWEQTETPWRPIVEKFLGQPVEFEFMRRHPFIVPRGLLVNLDGFCQQKHGMTIEQYVMSQPNRDFSEFNCLGAFAYYFHRDAFHWINTATETNLPPLTVRQEYSWGGLTDAIHAEFETILSGHGEQLADAKNVDPLPAQLSEKGGDATCAAPAMTRGTGPENRPALSIQSASSPAPTSDPERAGKFEPWESPLNSIVEIRSLAERLKKFCVSPAYTHKVRMELHSAGVIPAAKKKRRKARA